MVRSQWVRLISPICLSRLVCFLALGFSYSFSYLMLLSRCWPLLSYVLLLGPVDFRRSTRDLFFSLYAVIIILTKFSNFLRLHSINSTNSRSFIVFIFFFFCLAPVFSLSCCCLCFLYSWFSAVFRRTTHALENF